MHAFAIVVLRRVIENYPYEVCTFYNCCVPHTLCFWLSITFTKRYGTYKPCRKHRATVRDSGVDRHDVTEGTPSLPGKLLGEDKGRRAKR